uniref:uncharacterized protein LOC122771567 isoform X1 n=1 Tax=Solea senegalensis TaxID=28829 RepID=UPI001CD85CFA|nr:uncharacterized protein LOC122771567 isoform X1 [Solea senegalensis]
MTRVALTKLFTLVILAFIICLPEFFSSNRVSKVNFHCLPHRHCKRRNQTKRGENGKIVDADIKRNDECDPSQSAEQEKWETACTQWSQNNTTDRAPDSRRVGDDLEESWFMCQTDMDMTALHRNMSYSAPAVLKVHLEVSVEIQLSEAETVNLTLYGHSNNNTLDLHPPEEQKEEKEEEKEAGEGLQVFYCCLSVLSTSESGNHSRCLLWLANRTLSTATAKEKPQWIQTQKGEWQCIVRGLWLALLCVVLLTVVTIVLWQIYLGIQPGRTPTMYNFGNVTVQQLNAGEMHTETLSPEELSPIEEAHSQEEAETLLDGNVNGRIKSTKGSYKCTIMKNLRIRQTCISIATCLHQ